MAALPKKVPGLNTTPPKNFWLGLGVALSVLAAFALGVLVGRKQKEDYIEQIAEQDLTQQVAGESEAVTEETGTDGPEIEMIRSGQTQTGETAANETTPPTGSALAETATTTTQVAAAQTPTITPPTNNATVATPPAEAQVTEKPTTATPTTTAKKPASTNKTTTSAKGNYTVQIAAFRDRASAESLSDTLEARGYDAYVQRSEVPDKGVWYRVRVGAFASKDEAKKIADMIENKEGRSAYVTIR